MASTNYLKRKLRLGAALDRDDIARLDALTSTTRKVPAGHDLISEDERPEHVHVVQSGTACRYKTLPDGRRAIVALLLPGDFCDLHVAILDRMDHSIGALTDCEINRIRQSDLDAMLDAHPAVNRACLWASLVDEAILREWLVNVGRRPSEKQLAHLFCELYTRLDAVGLTHDHTFRMPFTQATLGDLLGISAVHVQRTMGQLRERGLIAQQDRQIQLVDFEALAELGQFDPGYLHLGEGLNP